MSYTKEELLKWQFDEKFQLEKVKEEGFNIQYIHNPSKKLQLIAIIQDTNSIKYIYNPSKEIQLIAVK